MTAPPTSRVRPRPAAPTGELAGLDLDQLRRHRGRLTAEDDRIAYWRCLTAARVADLVAESYPRDGLRLDQLVRALGATASGQGRRGIERVVAGHRLPELPTLCAAWTADPESSPRRTSLRLLGVAQKSLSAYEAALQDLMEDATRELILRYREDPTAALDAMPG